MLALVLANNPELIYSTGFELSVAAVFGILLLTNPLKALVEHTLLRPLKSPPTQLSNIICVSLAAQLATSPIVAATFNQVQDTTAPTLHLPDNITEEASDPNGNAVNFTATANDAVDGSISVNCTPASGSTFALTTTTVNCSATVAAGNTAQASFKVTVADTTAPSAVVSPADSAANVLKTTNVTASFSEAVHNVNTNTFKLERKIVSKKGTKYQPVPATVTTRDNSTTAMLNPSPTLPQGDYRATPTGGVTDTTGNALANALYSWGFTVKK